MYNNKTITNVGVIYNINIGGQLKTKIQKTQKIRFIKNMLIKNQNQEQ